MIIEKALKQFLSEIDKRLARKFSYFEKTMEKLPQKISEKNFAKLLSEYLTEFLKLTEPQ